MLGKKFATGIVSALLVAVSGCFSMAAADNLTVDGKNRTMNVYAPKNIEKNRPLIIQMHGMNQDAPYQQNAAKWESIADTARFIVVFPNGEGKAWDLSGNKDLNFLKAIINDMYTRYGIDKKRVYVSGFSMGGMMSYYAATKMADQIAAIAPCSGYPLGGGTPSGSRPMPIIHTHGTSDDVVNYNGGVSNLKNWVNYEKCNTNSTKYSQYPVGRTSSAASLEVWTGCQGGSEIRLMTIAGKGHWYSMDLASVNTSDEIWNFVKRFSLDGATGEGEAIAPAIVVPTNRDSIFNGGFDSTAVAWDLQLHSAKAVGEIKNGKYVMDIASVGDQPYSVQLIQHDLHLEKNQWYEVSFEASADAARKLEVNVEQHESPWDSYLKEKGNFDIGTEAKTYKLQFQMTAATDTNSRLSFNAGTSEGKLTLDNVSIKKIEAPAVQEPVCESADCEDPKTQSIGAQLNLMDGTMRTYDVFSLSGARLGQVKASSMYGVRDQIKLMTQRAGVYLVKTKGMAAYKISVK
ncbi:MAG: carbohydrate binding domain-containing protein [Fibrobacter sp.]|nr:carbohydrate binding domain-containing protein [Fibrobacter sp.]